MYKKVWMKENTVKHDLGLKVAWPPVAEKVSSDDEILQILEKKGRKLLSVAKRGDTKTDVWILDGHDFEDFTESEVGLEVGRKREDIFRLVQEGRGKERDLTKEIDNKYYHLFITMPGTGRIIAGYRFTIGREKLAEYDGSTEGFYNASLFCFDDELKEDFLPDAMELTRLFGEMPEKDIFKPHKFDKEDPETWENKYCKFPEEEEPIDRTTAAWEMPSLFAGLHRVAYEKEASFQIGSATLGGYSPEELLELTLYCLQFSSAEGGRKAGFTSDQVRAKHPENEITISEEKKEKFRKIFPSTNTLDKNIVILKDIYRGNHPEFPEYKKRKIKFPEAISPYTDVAKNEYIKFGPAVRNPDRSSGSEVPEEQSVEVFLGIAIREGITEEKNKFYGNFSGVSFLKKDEEKE